MGAGRQNILHAYAACDDPDCEFHNPEVIEDDDQRRTAKAWYVSGAYGLYELVGEALRNGHDAWTAVDMAIAELKDSHNLTEFAPTSEDLRQGR